eukprot:COSAG04_NODE_1237_length_7611_cov_4.313498_4_plen_124_part_00
MLRFLPERSGEPRSVYSPLHSERAVCVPRGLLPKALPATCPPRSVQARASCSAVHFGSTSAVVKTFTKRGERGALNAGGVGRVAEALPMPPLISLYSPGPILGLVLFLPASEKRPTVERKVEP